jgi:hypothetical protein
VVTKIVRTAKTMKKANFNTAETMTKQKSRGVPAPTKRALGVFHGPSNTDVNGSYTGLPKDKRETPVQDADDL